MNSAKMISIESVHILNPRDRNADNFQDIVDNISLIGLKRPITVTLSKSNMVGIEYDLVCGQGRLEAFKILRQNMIPAFIIEADIEDCFLMSLIENLARKQHTPLELLKSISSLIDHGYSANDVAIKTGLPKEYIKSIIHLLTNDEERLIVAVERNQIPITVAIDIAKAKNGEIQKALTDAYDNKILRGAKLQKARRIVEQRQSRGKSLISTSTPKPQTSLTAESMVRTYKHETDRQKAIILKSDVTERRLHFAISALKEFFCDENFMNLLRAEGLDTVPKQIIDLIE